MSRCGNCALYGSDGTGTYGITCPGNCSVEDCAETLQDFVAELQDNGRPAVSFHSEWLYETHMPAFEALRKRDEAGAMSIWIDQHDLEGITAETAAHNGILGLFQDDTLVAVARLQVDDLFLGQTMLSHGNVGVLDVAWAPEQDSQKGYVEKVVWAIFQRAHEFNPAIQMVTFDFPEFVRQL